MVLNAYPRESRLSHVFLSAHHRAPNLYDPSSALPAGSDDDGDASACGSDLNWEAAPPAVGGLDAARCATSVGVPPLRPWKLGG